MKLNAIDLVLGFDTEYVSEHRSAQEGEGLTFDPDALIRSGNRVLCISFAIYHPPTSNRLSGAVNLPPSRSRRWSLKQFIEQVLQAAEAQGLITAERFREADDRKPKRRCDPIRIILVGHFTRADLPGFSDFSKLKKKFSAVRKTYVTIATPYVFTARPGRHRAQVSITLRDTRLLAPEGFGSLAAIGDMLGRAKLSVPDVVDEDGVVAPGITRMDLVKEEHPQAFEDYARRDAELALDYFLKVSELANEMGVEDFPATIGALGVKVFKRSAQNFEGFMGRVPHPEKPRSLIMHPVIQTHAGIWANAYRGGRNQAFAHGVFEAPAGRLWNDVDIASAYTVAMAGIPSIDWDSASMPTSLAEIATLDAATVAQVNFRFPENTRFPCLPVPAGAGLLFPLAGETTTTGAELLAALNMGAKLEVITAMRFEFFEGTHEYAEFTRKITALRASFKMTNPLFEKLVKTAGNSLYGKIAQAVAGMRSRDPDRTKLFDTITGDRHELPPSAVTSPVHAAMTTAMIRAVLSEILSRLPSERAVLSVTTDGFLTDCTPQEALAATAGPIATLFKQSLESVAPGKSVLEVKHEAKAVVVSRTRGAFTMEAPEGYGGAPILARAGHKIDDFNGDDWAEAAEFIRLFIERTPGTTLKSRDFISVEDQWMADADLVALPITRRVNLDYDMGAQPVDVSEAHGVLRFTTRPWANKLAYDAARKAHADLRASSGHLKSMNDWLLIESRVGVASCMEIPGELEAVLQWMRAAAARDLCGKGKAMTLAEGAAAITELGLPTTPTQMLNAGKNVRARGLPEKPPGMVSRIKEFVPSTVSKHGVTVLEHAKSLIYKAETCPKFDGVKLYIGGREPSSL
jgi:hypothetical protein